MWWTRLPWGWGLSELGPREYGNRNAPIPPGDPRNILPSELNNPAIEPVARRYAELRYQLMPYTYTLAREARDTGLPLMRPLWLHYPARRTCARSRHAVPVGTRPADRSGLHEGRGVSRRVPAEGHWYDWWTNERAAGGRTRQSRGRSRHHADLRPRGGDHPRRSRSPAHWRSRSTDPTTLRIYPGASGQFTLYEDDGISQEYLAGRATWTRIAWDDPARRVTIEPRPPAGPTNVVAGRTFRVLLLPEGTSRDVTYVGRRVEVAVGK